MVVSPSARETRVYLGAKGMPPVAGHGEGIFSESMNGVVNRDGQFLGGLRGRGSFPDSCKMVETKGDLA
jgi:hypothetical protein